MVIKHLNERLSAAPTAQWLADREAAMREQTQLIATLKTELAEARANHTPAMRHFALLEGRIRDLEARQVQREATIREALQSRDVSAARELARCNTEWASKLALKVCKIVVPRLRLMSTTESRGRAVWQRAQCDYRSPAGDAKTGGANTPSYRTRALTTVLTHAFIACMAAVTA